VSQIRGETGQHRLYFSAVPGRCPPAGGAARDHFTGPSIPAPLTTVTVTTSRAQPQHLYDVTPIVPVLPKQPSVHIEMRAERSFATTRRRSGVGLSGVRWRFGNGRRSRTCSGQEHPVMSGRRKLISAGRYACAVGSTGSRRRLWPSRFLNCCPWRIRKPVRGLVTLRYERRVKVS
jgi:hypothetical protein